MSQKNLLERIRKNDFKAGTQEKTQKTQKRLKET
jgi:hypothetical protein